MLTPTVSASAPNAAFVATLTTADNKGGSGVVLPLAFILPPGAGNLQYSTSFLSAPVARGTVPAITYFGSGAPTGTWRIGGYGVCDAAGNCLIDTSGADVQNLLGTLTFTVAP